MSLLWSATGNRFTFSFMFFCIIWKERNVNGRERESDRKRISKRYIFLCKVSTTKQTSSVVLASDCSRRFSNRFLTRLAIWDFFNVVILKNFMLLSLEIEFLSLPDVQLSIISLSYPLSDDIVTCTIIN